MVGPRTPEERAAFRRRLAVGFVLLVGASGGLIALRARAGLVPLVGATAGGILVGLVLVWLAFPAGSDLDRPGRGRR